MARKTRCQRRLPTCRQLRSTPYPIPLNRYATERKDWEAATCSVCLEFPHNAVLLLCSSHDKGCRPYMCGTSFRYSNCLDLFKKAQSKSRSPDPHEPLLSLSSTSCKKSETRGLSCPLCRGQVKGWTVVDPAREHLNRKKRGCMIDGCLFSGNYKNLRKHMKAEHRCAKPRKADPLLEQKWKALELQREREDVMSTIRSSMPRSVVMGDYVIDMGSNTDSGDDDGDDEFDDDGNDDYGDGWFGGGGGGGSSQISRRFLYYLFREGARFMRFRRASPVSGDWEEGGGGDYDEVAAYPLEENGNGDGDDNSSRGRIVNLGRGRRRERRQQRQSRGRGRSVPSMS